MISIYYILYTIFILWKFIIILLLCCCYSCPCCCWYTIAIVSVMIPVVIITSVIFTVVIDYYLIRNILPFVSFDIVLCLHRYAIGPWWGWCWNSTIIITSTNTTTTISDICVLRCVETSKDGDEKVTQQALLVLTHIGNYKSVFEAMFIIKKNGC